MSLLDDGFTWPEADGFFPTREERELALRHANQFVYRMAKKVKDVCGIIPQEAIVGRWRVNSSGEIKGRFMPNPSHDPSRWPE